jgi:plasmid replication initiation protein
MSKDLVVKTNRLNQAFQVLTLAELHIVQLAIVDARETGTGLSTNTPLRIDAKRYAEVFNTTRQNAYQRMKEAEETLFNRRFSFYDESGKLIKSRWIQQVRYLDDEGAIELVLTLAVVQGISRIDGVKEFFTQYLLSQTSQLNSVYSARLYELLVQWRSAGKVPMIELVSFREQLGIGVNEYQRIDHFKARVLDSAVKEINEKTDIKVDYEQYKKGRSISGFSFKVKSKQNPKQLDSKRDPDTVDLFTKMTDAQRHLFAKKLSEMPDMSKYSQGTESFQQFAIRIAEMLLQPEKFRELYPLLEKAGFKP